MGAQTDVTLNPREEVAETMDPSVNWRIDVSTRNMAVQVFDEDIDDLYIEPEPTVTF